MVTKQIAKHFRDVHFGGNWTTSNLKDQLEGLNWEQATTKVYSFNTIATLVFHVNYYVSEVLKVLHGGPLEASDRYSFDAPLIASEADWERLKNKALSDAEAFADLIETLPEGQLFEDFTDAKYGNYYRNLHGIIEHTHYHLGQIALVRKVVMEQETKI